MSNRRPPDPHVRRHGPRGSPGHRDTAVAPRARGRTPRARGRVVDGESWRAPAAAAGAAAEWSAQHGPARRGARRVAATAGSCSGSSSAGWSGWSPARIALALLLASVPFLFGARSYDVDLPLAHERVVAGDGVAGEIVVRNHGRRTALPGRIDIPVGEGLVEFGVPLLRPAHSCRPAARHPGPARAASSASGRPPRCAATRIGLLRREHAFDDVHQLYVHPADRRAALHERRPDPRSRGQPDPAPRRRRHVVPRDPRVRRRATPAARSTGSRPRRRAG